MSQNYGLGRGLASLIPQKNKKDADLAEFNTKKTSASEQFSNGGNRTLEIEISKITANPYQPRVKFDAEKLEELSQSIKSHGIIQPIVVSQSGSRFELIAGERRLQAAKLAGLERVPVVVRSIKEKEKLELALAENIQRHNLNPIEEANAYQRMEKEFQMSQEEVARKIGKSRSAVANKTRLLNLPTEVQKALIEENITEGHAKAILAIGNSEKQRALLDLILKSNLTVRQAEDKTKEISVKSHQRKVNIDPEIKELENKLTGILGTKVKVKQSGDGGRIVIDYYSEEELNGILDKIVLSHDA